MKIPFFVLFWMMLPTIAPTIVLGQSTVVSPHGKLLDQLTCISCHTNDAWTPVKAEMQFDHAQDAGFPLLNAHSVIACASCHVELQFDAPKSSVLECQNCHEDPHLGNLNQTCATCHTTVSFQDKEREFAHLTSSFELIGSHNVVSCESCHKLPSLELTFSPPPSGNEDCATCHAADYEEAHAGTGFPETCLTCHGQTTWDDASFDHVVQSDGFDLVGSHKTLACESCHNLPGLELTFSPAPSGNEDCVTCHAPDYEEAHAGTGFPATCLTCHGQTTWQDAVFDHVVQSEGFDLVGSHNILACESCHNLPGLELTFSPAPSGNEDCVTCHAPDYEEAHAGTGFPSTCLTCHGQTTWDDATFDHVVQANGFDLIGSHNVLACESCHNLPGLELLFAPPPSNNDDCASCHASDYETAHAGSGFPVTCIDCHGQATWDDATFDHLEQSGGFDLIGSHNVLACESCHNLPGLELLFAPAPSNNDDCASCHTSDYETAHAGSGFPVTCIDCHGQSTWDDVTFDHLEQSGGFDLIGSHNVLACESCHNLPGLELLFAPPPSNNDDCASCHTSDYESAHAGSGFPETCATCHGQTTWEGASFDHVVQANGFDLIGSHNVLACESCHNLPGLELLFAPPPSNNDDCASCHTADYETAHAGSGFPTTCVDCHGQTTWEGATFDHVVQSDGFDLIGSHSVLACESCHNLPGLDLLFAPPPANNNDCVTCHSSDYQTAHAGSGFPTTCVDCHSQTTWSGATFDHVVQSKGFDLLGSHSALACESCHSLPSLVLLFTPPPSNNDDCVTCHTSDYQTAHAGSGFPTTCVDCHSQTTWDDATFDHDAQFFPIYSGKHRNEWNQCADCHRQAPASFATFSCIDCHEHRKSSMDSEHRGINGYVYDSVFCFSCHPQGRE